MGNFLVLGLDSRSELERQVRRCYRAARFFANRCEYYLKNGYYAILITLTFKGNNEVREKVISEFLNNVRNYVAREAAKRGLNKRKVFYFWTIELQGRGVPHYHVVLLVPQGIKLNKPDEWVWRHGSSNIKAVKSYARDAIGRVVRYVIKYARKGFKDLEKLVQLKFVLKSLGKKLRLFSISHLLKDYKYYLSVAKRKYLRKVFEIVYGDKVICDYAIEGDKMYIRGYRVGGIFIPEVEIDNFFRLWLEEVIREPIYDENGEIVLWAL